MKKINPQQRKLLSEKIFDVSNIAAGALVFGQFISSDTFKWYLLVAGFVVFIMGYTIAFLIAKKLD